jgi:hypothetical protein
MKGIRIKYLGREYYTPSTTISCCLISHRNEFTFEDGSIIHSFRKISDDIAFEIELADFDKPSEPISESNQMIDPEYVQMINERGEDWELE